MKTLASLVVTFLLVPAAFGQRLEPRQTFVLAPDGSEVKMTLKTTHEIVHGTFHVDSGSIEFDRGTRAMSGSVKVQAGSGKTGNGTRDKKMDKDILQVEHYATVSFEPKSYAGTIAASGDSTIQITGMFTLLGKAHEITVPTLIHVEGTTASAKSHFVVPYVQWGLKNPSFLVWKAENDVDIDLLLTGRLTR